MYIYTLSPDIKGQLYFHYNFRKTWPISITILRGSCGVWIRNQVIAKSRGPLEERAGPCMGTGPVCPVLKASPTVLKNLRLPYRTIGYIRFCFWRLVHLQTGWRSGTSFSVHHTHQIWNPMDYYSAACVGLSIRQSVYIRITHFQFERNEAEINGERRAKLDHKNFNHRSSNIGLRQWRRRLIFMCQFWRWTFWIYLS